MLTMSHYMEFKKLHSHDDVSIIPHTTKVRIYHFFMVFVDVRNLYLVQFFHKRLHVHHIYNFNEGRIIAKFDS